MPARPRRLGPLVAVLVTLLAAAYFAVRSTIAAVIVGGALLVLALRGLFLVLGARAAMADPDERDGRRTSGPGDRRPANGARSQSG